MLVKPSWLPVLLLAIPFPALRAADSIVLVHDGTSAYTICISQQASPSEKRAARELQRFLEEMSGARLPVVTDDGRPKGPTVFVGRSVLTDRLRIDIPSDRFGPEGFELKTAGKHLVIAGGRQRGTMYGVYTFLEKLGCRWFTPEVSRIPRLRTIELQPLDEVQTPAFEYREPYFTEAWDKDWSARNKTNGHFQRLDESTGGKVQYFPFVHTFYQMIPPAKYFKDHPEYFSLIDGKRRVEQGQLCLTNPEVLQLSVKTVLDWIVRHPEATIFSVSQNDWEGWCECLDCRRVEQEEGGTHSGPILRFVNALAEEVEKKHPDKLIDTLAYWYSEDPPVKVRPRRNVRIRLCPIGACEAHPYEQCTRNAYFMKNLKAWSGITSQLYIWHYNTNFSHYLLPFPDFDELAADLPMYQRHGVVGVFLEGCYAPGGGAENAELRSYVMAKLLWDTHANVEQLVNEFHDAYYGKSAKLMLEYFDLLQAEVRTPPRGQGQHLWIYGVPDYSDQLLSRARDLFRRAEQSAESEAVRSRIQRARLSIDYLDLLQSMRFEVKDGRYTPNDLVGLNAQFGTFLAEVRRFGVTELHEDYNLAEDERRFHSNLRPYQATTLENASLRVDVVPELQGRVVRLIDKRTGRNVLRRLDLGEYENPDTGGLATLVSPDYYSKPREIKWTLKSPAEPLSLTLTSSDQDGLKLEQVLRIPAKEPVLNTEIVVEASGNRPVEVVLQSRFEADPGSVEDAVVTFRKQDGTLIERKLILPNEQPSGLEIYSGSNAPGGQWRLLSGAGRSFLLNGFRKEQVERCSLDWNFRTNPSVVLTVWSKKRSLVSRERLTMETSYRLE
ncbi:MAG TPA: DUF4838 domain-containing protein [Terriglobia bacterium]|nr:DUF4838 domain-containing protein [Terriglobia bacterium]